GVVITYSTPYWEIAMEPEAVEGPVTIDAPAPNDSAYIFDMTDPSSEVAGFLVSRDAVMADGNAVHAAQLAVQKLAPFALAGVTIQNLRAAGTRNTSLDGYDTVLLTTVELHTTILDVTALRAEIVQALSGKPASAVHMPPIAWSG